MSKMDEEELKRKALEEKITKIIQCAYNVRGVLPKGFLEKVYKNALYLELREYNLNVTPEAPIDVYYKGVVVGEYRADMLVDNDVIIELKATQCLTRQDEVQLVNYLTALHVDTGLLINFGGENLEIKRKYREYKKTR